jgi:polyhydroxyalkanoate synthesis regulator phasin
MNQPSFDPVAAWQQMVQSWEREINEWSGKVTSRDEFSAVMGQISTVSLAAQKALADRMENTLRQLNLPSKGQIDALAERLDAIEEAITRLRLALEPGATIPAAASAPKPARSRKPPA